MLNAYGLPRTRSLVSTNFGFYSSSRFSFRAWRDRRTNSHTPLKALSTRRRQSPAWVITKTQPVRCIAGTHPVKFWSIYFISIGRIYRVDFKAAFCDVPIGGRDVAILVCKRRRRSFGPRVMILSESFLGVNKISLLHYVFRLLVACVRLRETRQLIERFVQLTSVTTLLIADVNKAGIPRRRHRHGHSREDPRRCRKCVS